MKGKIKIITTIALCLFLVVVIAGDLFSLEHYAGSKARKFVLDNGMTVIAERITTSPVVSLTLLVKAGSATEGEFLGSGISHFVEHMLFKGTQKRQPGQIFREIESLGGEINGFTSYDYTGYTVTLPREELNQGLEVLADAVMNSQFDPQEMEKERQVILAEIRLNKDDPDRRIYQLLFSGAYTWHAYRHPVIGYEHLLKDLTRKDLLEYYKKMYVPNNLILAVAGDIVPGDVLSAIKNEFGRFEMRPYPEKDIFREPEQISLRRVEEEYPTDLSRMFLGFKSTPILHPDLFAMDVLALILGLGESSRLYTEVYRNKGLVHSIYSSNYTLMQGGLFAIRCTLEKEKTQEAIKAVLAEIDKVKKGSVKAQELGKAKRQLISSYIFSRQTPSQITADLAVNEAVTGDFGFSEKYLEGIKRVGLKDIQRVAKKYLNEETLTIAVLNPAATQQQQELPAEEPKKPEIEKAVLDNGLTVLLKEDTNLPIVSIKALFLGGLRAETEETNGISNLTSRMLLRGTKTRSAQTLAQEIESLGASIEPFSGSNSFGLSLDILSQDLDKGLRLLADIVINPDFSEEELTREKNLVLSQIKARDDNVFKLAFKSLRQVLFKVHPYRFNELGTEESVKRINRRDIVEFYKNFGLPNNMVLAVFGDIESEDTLKLIEKSFAKLNPAEISLNLPSESFSEKPAESIIQVPKQQAVIMFGFPGVRLTHAGRYPLEVLNSILTSAGGRLFQRIREELGQAYALGGDSLPGIEQGFYYIYVSTAPENLDEVKEIILQEIQNLKTDYVDEKELSAAKSSLIGIQKMGLQTYSALAFKSGLDELYGLGFDNYKLYQERISGVTKEDIMSSAAECLDLNKMGVVTIAPHGN